MSKYDMVITWSAKDHAYIVSVPELPGCMADGATREEAIQNAETIISEWIEYARLCGRDVPSPRCESIMA